MKEKSLYRWHQNKISEVLRQTSKFSLPNPIIETTHVYAKLIWKCKSKTAFIMFDNKKGMELFFDSFPSSFRSPIYDIPVVLKLIKEVLFPYTRKRRFI